MDLNLIPPLLLKKIVERTDYDSFTKLAQTNMPMSKRCLKSARNKANPVYKIVCNPNMPIQVSKLIERELKATFWEDATEVPCPIHAEAMYMRTHRGNEVEQLADVFEENGTRVKSLNAHIITMEPEILQRLLEAIKCKELACYRMNPDYFDCLAVQKLESILVNNMIYIQDAQLLRLDAFILRLNAPDISNNCINLFLKQWRRKERTAKDFVIWRDLDADDVDEIIDGVNANVVWSPEYHYLTDANHIDIGQIEPNVRIFSLFPSDDISNVHILYILSGKIRFYQDLDEKYVLRTLDRNEDWL